MCTNLDVYPHQFSDMDRQIHVYLYIYISIYICMYIQGGLDNFFFLLSSFFFILRYMVWVHIFEKIRASKLDGIAVFFCMTERTREATVEKKLEQKRFFLFFLCLQLFFFLGVNLSSYTSFFLMLPFSFPFFFPSM